MNSKHFLIIRIFFTLCVFLSFISSFLFLFEKLSLSNKVQLSEDLHKSLEEKYYYKTIGHIPAKKSEDPPQSEYISSPKYTLMIRTMYNLSKVEAYLDHLEKKGVKAFYSPIKAGDKIIYKIRRGVFKDKTLAAKAKHELAKKYHMEASLETLR